MKHTLFFSTPSHRATRANVGARGFTLIELMVVLAVVAIVSAITLGGFKEMREGNKRVSCQTNLSQIYQASRLYAADEGGKLPYYEPDCTVTPATTKGIGLWALYTFPDPGDPSATPTPIPADPNLPAPRTRRGPVPLERYLKNAKSLHCPSDNATGRENLYTDDTKTVFNPDYLSYQTCDNGTATPGTPGVATYATQRVSNAADVSWKRQLIHYNGANFVSRQPTGDTVVAYCLFHRDQRDADNVLFYDGSVQTLARNYNGETDWKRLPKAPQ